MAYVKAVLAALGAALLLGVVTGALTGAAARLPDDRAVVYAMGVSEAVNCTAFFALVLVPLAVIVVFDVRKWRRRSAPDRER